MSHWLHLELVMLLATTTFQKAKSDLKRQMTFCRFFHSHKRGSHHHAICMQAETGEDLDATIRATWNKQLSNIGWTQPTYLTWDRPPEINHSFKLHLKLLKAMLDDLMMEKTANITLTAPPHIFISSLIPQRALLQVTCLLIYFHTSIDPLFPRLYQVQRTWSFGVTHDETRINPIHSRPSINVEPYTPREPSRNGNSTAKTCKSNKVSE